MPINGMIRAAHALRYWEQRQQVVANNLANVDTAGFKAERVFGTMLEDARPVADAATDLRAGALKQTDGPLDFALGGDGFFVVGTPQGERLTRGGTFHLDPDGRVVDANGNPLLGESGEILLPPGEVVVTSDGALTVDGKPTARLRVVTVPEGTELTHAGGNLFAADATEPIADEARDVRQGYLEDSNVETVSEMVDMISIQRAYSALQRTVTTLDSIRSTIANDIAKV